MAGKEHKVARFGIFGEDGGIVAADDCGIPEGFGGFRAEPVHRRFSGSCIFRMEC